MASDPHCFVCLEQRISNNSNNLFRYIFHYLQMTQKKKILRDCSTSKLQLCLDCTMLTENFSVLYNQLEKVRMEMDSYLKIICDKIVRSEGKVEGPEDIQDIREELLLNCTNNFRESFPQLKLSRLRTEDIQVWKAKKLNFLETEGAEINEGIISLNELLETELAPNVKIEVGDTEISFEDQSIPSAEEDLSEDIPNSKFEAVYTDISFVDQLTPNVKEDVDPFEELLEDEDPSEPIIMSEVDITLGSEKKRRKNEDPAIEAFIISTNTDINGPSSLTCGGCGMIFSRRDMLKRHISSSHLNIKRYQCPGCPKRFKRRYKMLQHFKLKHTSEGDQCKKVPGKTVTCNICGALFSNTTKFREHRALVHNEQITFPCDICPRVCYKEEDLHHHKRLHSVRNLEITCLKCGEVFDDPLMKKQHMIDVHYKPKFKCAVKSCPSIYARKSTLIDHFKKHHKGMPCAYRLMYKK